MANVTHAVVTDITPNRCTVQHTGSVESCYEFMGNDTDGNGFQRILEIVGGELEVGERAWHRDGIVSPQFSETSVG